MRRVAFVGLALIIAALAMPRPSLATDPSTGCGGYNSDRYGCDDGQNGKGNGGGGGGGPLPNGYWYLQVAGTPPCWSVLYSVDPTFVPVPDSWTYATAHALGVQYWGNLYPECNSPGALAGQVWHDQKPVPAQHPALQPDNSAVTGKKAYLTISGGQTVNPTFPNPLGPSPTISATVSYDIDWGDGSSHTLTSSPGMAWPGGASEITHVYSQAGARTIVVHAIWSGTWTAPGTVGGNLPVLTLDYPLAVDVNEIQAVRNR